MDNIKQPTVKLEHQFILLSCLLFILLVLDSIVFSFIATHTSMTIVLHIILALAAGGIVWWYNRENWSLRIPIVAALFFLTMGPIGAAICLFVVPLYIWDKSHTMSLREIISTYFIQDLLSPSAILYDRITNHLEDIDPSKIPPQFQDLMAYGSVQQKTIIIQKMLRYFNPKFVPILRQGLHDPSNSIRVQSATAISTLNHRYFQKYLDLRSRLEQDNDNPELLLKFADFCQDYAFSGLGDEERTQNMRRYSLVSYEKYLEKYAPTTEIRLSLGRLYLEEEGEVHEAYNWLKPIFDEPHPPVKAYEYMMKALMMMHDYEGVRTLAYKAQKDPLLPQSDEVVQTLLLWTTGFKGDFNESE